MNTEIFTNECKFFLQVPKFTLNGTQNCGSKQRMCWLITKAKWAKKAPTIVNPHFLVGGVDVDVDDNDNDDDDDDGGGFFEWMYVVYF